MNKLLVDGIYATNIVKLKDIAEKKTAKNIYGLVTETFTNSAENGIISQSDFFDRTITNDKNISGYYIVEPDDFVYNPRISTFAPVGPINRNKLGRSGVMSPLYLVFHTHDVEPEYLEWYFKSNAWHQFMRDNGNTGARSDRFSISDAEFFNMPIPIPPVKVQKAIAKTLTTLDTKVILEKNEVEKFLNLKSAMLTKMFPKKGENVPEIRFDGFTDAWEQRKLGNIGNTYTGLSGKTSVDFGHGDASFITYMNVYSNPVSNPNMVDHVEIDSTQREIAVGDVCFTTSSETPDEVGMSSVITEKRGITYLNSFCFGYRPTIKFDLNYLAYMLRSNNVRKNIILLAQGISRYNVSKNKMMEIYVPVPNLDEQKAIGAYFSNLDNLIAFHQRKYEKLIDTKKAFLEKLIGGEK